MLESFVDELIKISEIKTAGKWEKVYSTMLKTNPQMANKMLMKIQRHAGTRAGTVQQTREALGKLPFNPSKATAETRRILETSGAKIKDIYRPYLTSSEKDIIKKIDPKHFFMDKKLLLESKYPQDIDLVKAIVPHLKGKPITQTPTPHAFTMGTSGIPTNPRSIYIMESGKVAPGATASTVRHELEEINTLLKSVPNLEAAKRYKKNLNKRFHEYFGHYGIEPRLIESIGGTPRLVVKSKIMPGQHRMMERGLKQHGLVGGKTFIPEKPSRIKKMEDYFVKKIDKGYERGGYEYA